MYRIYAYCRFRYIFFGYSWNVDKQWIKTEVLMSRGYYITLIISNIINPQERIVLWKCSNKSDMSLKIMSLTYITYCYIYNKKQNLLLGVRVCKVFKKENQSSFKDIKRRFWSKKFFKGRWTSWEKVIIYLLFAVCHFKIG